MWMLFIIVMQAESYMVSPHGPFRTMDDCFGAREVFMESAPKPKMNYEAVCVQTDVLRSGA